MTAAHMQAAAITVDGQQMIGGLYRAAGTDPLPAVAFLHGLPGHELNLDLAQALRASGIHALFFHFRGSWGSSGAFRLGGLVEDTKAALHWLGRQPGIDPTRLCLIGFSLGGWACLATYAQLPELRAAVAISPLVDPGAAPFDPTLTDGLLDPLSGTDVARVEREWNGLPPLNGLVEPLADRPLLLVTGDQDSIFPPDHYTAFMERLPSATWERFPSADHGFSSVRSGLIHRVRTWLLHHLREPVE